MLKRFEQFTSAIAAISRDVQRIERDEMEKHGLRGAFAQYLLALSRHPEGITAAGLCEVCDKDKAAVSRIVSEMDAKELILREAGGEVVSVWGGPPPLDGESAIVSTNGKFTEELRALM